MTKRILSPSVVLYPVPVVLVTCAGPERPNIITLAWTGVACSDPPMLSIAVRPARYSNGLIKSSQEFVVNIPTVSLLDQIEYCGTVSGRTVDKFAACGFSPEPASVVNAPLIAECPVNIECTVCQIIPLGVHDLFLGRVVSVHMDDTVLDARGELDPVRADPIAYISHAYYRIGARLIPAKQ